VLFLASLFTSYSNSQEAYTAGTLTPGEVYSTGNIVQPVVAGSNSSPWVNGVYQQYLMCMAGGQQGNCGPNPSVTPLYGNGYMVFSYGYTDLYQVRAVASVLPTTGLRVNGYNFGFTAKNGSGWDDGRVDTLSAYVSFYGTDGKVVDYTNYNLNSKFNWTQFNYTKDFVTPYADKDLSTVQYGFVGKDNNFWAGNYGPEIMDVSFSLKYSVDPCATNVLSSPTCPGYAEALAKLIPESTATTTEAAIPVAEAPTPPPPLPPPPGANPQDGQMANGPLPPPGTPGSAGGPPAAGPVTTASSQPPQQAAGGAQPKVGEVQSSSNKSGPSLSAIMSILSTEANKISAVEKSVAQAATQQAVQAGAQATAQAEAVASALTAQSIAGSMSASNSGTGLSATSTTQTQTSAFALPGSVQSNVFSGNGLRTPAQLATSDAITLTSSVNSTSSVSFGMPAQSGRNAGTPEVEVQQQTMSLTGRSALSDYLEAKQFLQLTGQTQTTDTVKRNVQPNELAGGVDLNAMATQPAGFQAYSVVMPDVAFYSPREIYKNQRTVDNARVLRGLQGGSDRLHQDLVDLQYNKETK